MKDFLPRYLRLSQFLPKYLQSGLCEIVIIDHKLSENSRGDETVTETVVAMKGSCYVKVTAKAYRRGGFGIGGNGISIVEEVIAETEYKRLAKGKMTIDTSEVRKEIGHLESNDSSQA